MSVPNLRTSPRGLAYGKEQCYSYDFHLGRIWFRGDISFEGDISPVPGYFEGDIGYGGPSALRF